MEHAHLADTTRPIDDNAALALVLDPSIQPEDLAPRMGLSLTQLATWSREHAPQLADLKEFFATRATLIASRLHMASLAALERVLNLAKDPDAKTQERSRKAASTILRNLAPPAPCKASSPTVREGSLQPTPHALPPALAPVPAPSSHSEHASPKCEPLGPHAPSAKQLLHALAPPASPASPSSTLPIAHSEPPAARLRALAGGAPAVHLPCFYTQLVIVALSLRDLLQPAVPRRIPA